MNITSIYLSVSLSIYIYIYANRGTSNFTYVLRPISNASCLVQRVKLRATGRRWPKGKKIPAKAGSDDPI